ncbi:acetyltransferase (GNAT) family protein [Tahibacter aquaticus]|uniref:Acetyltransferase (GNAT) family protein n=1 Tax=Tahibacter aquaticus TaxID=520092 RepID=A0A4R6Z2D3_9GAMM|nr:GNAT family N-acetyltransferase [Tahibacter aquaticus]TDR45743.1 acetyltransferase (GNAT) family protein [Tahibacter aquaticus]
MAIAVEQPQTAADWSQARLLVEAYAASLDVDLALQNFSRELERLAQDYAPPRGTFLLARENGASLGCVGLRRHAAGVAELKRLYVLPAAQGRGVGRHLVEAVVVRARELGYRRLLLDTLPSMRAAQSLYRALGFREISAYGHNPVPGTVYFALELG